MRSLQVTSEIYYAWNHRLVSRSNIHYLIHHGIVHAVWGGRQRIPHWLRVFAIGAACAVVASNDVYAHFFSLVQTGDVPASARVDLSCQSYGHGRDY